MLNLREQLQQCFESPVCLMGLGNVDYGDDGFGVRLAEALGLCLNRSHNTVVIVGTEPERFIGRAGDGSFDHIIFLDAVDFGGSPGTTVFLDGDQIAARFPQLSTHKLSLGLLAKTIEANGRTKAWILGVQPESLKAGEGLTPTVQTTLGLLHELLVDVSMNGSFAGWQPAIQQTGSLRYKGSREVMA